MQKRFRIAETLICSFILKENGIVEPDDRYPLRLCVIDEEKEIAIDVEHKLQYDYIKTSSSIYLQHKAINHIKDNKRAAIFGCVTLESDISDKTMLKNAKDIIKSLEKNKKFIDGNSALNNDEYLEIVKRKKENPKTKKINFKNK